ncbi:DUF551 domain-containing protein [Klebsiella pneumoniae]
MTDITELAQRMKAAAEKATPGEWWADEVKNEGCYGSGDDCVEGFTSYAIYGADGQTLFDSLNSDAACISEEYDGEGHVAWDETAQRNAEFIALANPANILALVEALEKAQGMETYWKTQCRGITDHCEELQARIAELESHTVKPPVHPTVASENLDDETLQELIEFRRTTFEYHSKEGNKVQTIIHGVTLAALRELQERRKADSEPVAEVVSIYGDHEAFGEREIRPLIGIQQMPYGTKLYRHAQQPVVPQDVLDALQKVARIRLDLNDFDGDRRGIADCLCDAEEALIEVVNRRAAMLAAAPQSPGGDHATVPGKWIPVSERMPEAEGHYLVWANASRIDGYCDHLAMATYQGGEWSNEFNWLVTHWMPLPAAPQEAINALISLVSRNEREVK